MESEGIGMGNFESISFNQNFFVSKNSQKEILVKNASNSNNINGNNGIITASSWRIGEALVQKQLKHHLRQQQQQNSSKIDRLNILGSKLINEDDQNIQITKKTTSKKLMNEEERRSGKKLIKLKIIDKF